MATMMMLSASLIRVGAPAKKETNASSAVEPVARGGSALDPYVVGQLMHRTDLRGLNDLTERAA